MTVVSRTMMNWAVPRKKIVVRSFTRSAYGSISRGIIER
jgi:hypothetical protein